MNTKEFLALLDKYIANKTNHEEEKLLLSYFESFQQNNDWFSELGSQAELKERMLKRLMRSIDQPQKNKKNNHLPFLKICRCVSDRHRVAFLICEKRPPAAQQGSSTRRKYNYA